MRSLFPLIAAGLVLGCGPKKVDESSSLVGWNKGDAETWTGSCYFPPDYEALEASEGLTSRKLARQASLEAMISQWRGDRLDGVSFDSGVIEDVEITLLGRPEHIEDVSQKNLEFCKQTMGAGAGTGNWESWLKSLPDELTAGECNTPLQDTYFHYFDINASWQLSIPVCAGDGVRFSASKDRYRVSDDGEWIDADGSGAAAGADYPCNREGCNVGMMVARFTSEDGVEDFFPVGRSATWTAPSHGSISITVNDTSYYDNTWYQSGSIIDHTSVEIGPN